VNTLPVQRASDLECHGPQTHWLVEELWTDQAVGILGGEPKCCKSFLALDVAVSVASGAAALRQFPVRRSGPVLLFPAEDSLAVVRQRLEGIAAAAQVPFGALPVQVITAPSLRLDTEADRQRLSRTVQEQRPVLLILDPLIRLHRVENDATQIAALLSFFGTSNASSNWLSCSFTTPARTPTAHGQAKPCVVPANSTAGATPISICAVKVPN
jgi:hypothetical protein